MKEYSFNPIPENPYFFINSKNFPGKSLEYLLFNDSNAFFKLSNRPYREKDKMRDHMKFLLIAGDNLKIDYLCPICGQRNVKFVLFRNCTFLSKNLSCCDNPDCRQALLGGSGDRLIAIKLRSLRQFNKKSSQKKAEKIFREFLDIKRNDNPERILAIVSEVWCRQYYEKNISPEIKKNFKKKSFQLKLF